MTGRWTTLLAYLPFFFALTLLSTDALNGQSDSTYLLTINKIVERAQQDISTGNLEALDLRLDSLYTIAQRTEHQDRKLLILEALTELSITSRKLIEATKYSEMALAIVRSNRSNLPDTLVDQAYFLHAEIHIENGEWNSFETYIDSSYQILDNLEKEDPVRQARNAIRMSFLSYNQGNLSKTIEWTQYCLLYTSPSPRD